MEVDPEPTPLSKTLPERKVAVVTGASRGIGRGVALGLAEAGMTVYITGRTRDADQGPWPGSITATAAEVTRLGGRGIAVPCDHRNDSAVEALFQQISEAEGRLDILVNNATSFGASPTGYPPDEVPFWQVPVSLWDDLHSVGLRSHYVAAVLAAPIMVAQRVGLIVNISSAGATEYVFGVAYGAAKAGLDKMTADMGVDLRPHNVAVVSLWPSFTRTEKYAAQLDAKALDRAVSPQLVGRAVAALAADPEIMMQTGRALRVSDLAQRYNFRRPAAERD